MNELARRITEVIGQHLPGSMSAGAGIQCTAGCTREWEPAHVAEAVAADLNPYLVDLRQFLQKAEECVYANVGPSPVLVEIRAAMTWVDCWWTVEGRND